MKDLVFPKQAPEIDSIQKEKIYIAGKITDCPGYKERFAEAEKMLRTKGYAVMNPAILPDGFTHAEYLYICFSMIDVCGAVYFLDNWHESPGATREFRYASVKRKRLLYEGVEENI
jgi:hypothetical protein